MCIRNASTNIPGSTGLETLKRRCKDLPDAGEYEQEFHEALTVEEGLEWGLTVYRRAFVDSIGARAVGLIEEFEQDCATKSVYLSENVAEATRKLVSLLERLHCWGRRNVLIEPEEVCRIVFPLQCDEPIILDTTVGGPHTLVTFVAA